MTKVKKTIKNQINKRWIHHRVLYEPVQCYNGVIERVCIEKLGVKSTYIETE